MNKHVEKPFWNYVRDFKIVDEFAPEGIWVQMLDWYDLTYMTECMRSSGGAMGGVDRGGV